MEKRRFWTWVAVVVLTVIAVPVVFAQGGEPVEPVVDWLTYAMVALNSLMIPLGADLIKGYVRPIIPSWLMSFLPVVLGSLIALAEVKLAELVGFAVDLSLIEQAFLGGGGGLASTVAFKFGESHARA